MVNLVKLASTGSFLFLFYLTFVTNVWGFTLGVVITLMCLKILRNVLDTKLPPHGKAVFITGCDSGFGHFLSLRLDEKGYKVFSGCLLPEGPGAEQLRSKCSKRLQVVTLDVTSESSVKDAEEYVRSHLEDSVLWGVVNNAGLYGHGDVELCSLEMYKKVAEVNLYGQIRVIKAFLPLIRKYQGRFVNMSSIYGRYSGPSTSPYNASKYGVECISDSLRMETAKFGVKVSIIEPAMFGGSTNIHSDVNIKQHYSEIDKAWKNFDPAVRQTYTKKYMQEQIDRIAQFRSKVDAKSPDAVLDAIEHALSSSYPKCRYVVHGGPLPIDLIAIYGILCGFLPEFVTDWVGRKLANADSTQFLRDRNSNCVDQEE